MTRTILFCSRERELYGITVIISLVQVFLSFLLMVRGEYDTRRGGNCQEDCPKTLCSRPDWGNPPLCPCLISIIEDQMCYCSFSRTFPLSNYMCLSFLLFPSQCHTFARHQNNRLLIISLIFSTAARSFNYGKRNFFLSSFIPFSS